MKTSTCLLLHAGISFALILVTPAWAKPKDLELVDVEFQGDKEQVAIVEKRVREDPGILKGNPAPCIEVPKDKGKSPDNKANFLCKPLLDPLQALTKIYQEVIAPAGYDELPSLSMTMSTTIIPDCSQTKCEASDGAKCKAYRRSVYYPYRCYDENFLGSSTHECF